MNQRQQERVADLGRAFQEAITDIVNSGYDTPESTMEENVRMSGELPRDINHGLATYEVTISHLHNGFLVNVG